MGSPNTGRGPLKGLGQLSGFLEKSESSERATVRKPGPSTALPRLPMLSPGRESLRKTGTERSPLLRCPEKSENLEGKKTEQLREWLCCSLRGAGLLQQPTPGTLFYVLTNAHHPDHSFPLEYG